MTVKQERYESLIKKEVALVIQNQLNDPSLDLVSVTDVELTNDMSYATIYVSFLKEENKEKGMEALQKAKGLLRSKVAGVMTTRRTPEILIKFDDSIVRGSKIDEILAKIKDED